MLSSKVYRTGTAGRRPAFNVNRIRDIAGLDANRVDDAGLNGLVDAAISAFEQETGLRIVPGTFTAEFTGGNYTIRAGGTRARLTIPGWNASLESVSSSGNAIEPANYRTWPDDANGSLHIEPADNRVWDVYPSTVIQVAFRAGVSELSAVVQEIVGVRVRYDYYAEEGDGIAFIHRCEPYNYLRSQR